MNNITSYLKELEKEETNTKVSRNDETSKKKKTKKTTNETESWFSEKINKIYKLLERFKKKRK